MLILNSYLYIIVHKNAAMTLNVIPSMNNKSEFTVSGSI